jgi:hypothetical protein
MDKESEYYTRNLNILPCQDVQPCTFWKGIVWAAKVVKVD